MLGITVELGSYSVKFLTYKVDRKETILLETDEVITDYDSLDPKLEVEKLWENQLDIIKDYLTKFSEEYQIMMTLPSDIISTRFLTLPVKNKKTALSMLPFQIEEDLPFPLSDCHWAESLNIEKTHSEAVVAVVKKVHFDSFFNLLKSRMIRPKILTSDVSSLSKLILEHKDYFPENFCIIDIGHHATRGFYFSGGKLVSNHNSYVAGAAVTESISKSYSISTDEATIYKHQNSFLLLEDQYDEVNENQSEFARVMDATLQPLMLEIKRWDIGFRVTHGVKVDEVYICGGSANIKNIKNYLADKLNCSVQFFDPYKFVESSHIDSDERFRNKFSQAVALTSNAPKKSRLINFLKNDYVLEMNTDLPFQSMMFISTRLAIISCIFTLFFIIKGLLLSSDISNARKFVSINLNKPQIDAPKRIERAFKGSKEVSSLEHGKLQKLLQRKKKLLKEEAAIIKESLKPGALNYFSQITSALASFDIEIMKFIISESNDIDLVLKANDESTLKSVQAEFEAQKIMDWRIEIVKDKLLIKLGASGVSK